jgi:hypothetical protein
VARQNLWETEAEKGSERKSALQRLINWDERKRKEVEG